MVAAVTTETFIERANLYYDNYYDYSKTEYVNKLTPVLVICPKHGEFSVVPRNHLLGQGCVECKTIAKTNTFIENAISIHGDKYDYSQTVYSGSRAKLTIICRTHGAFEVTAHAHVSLKRGCPVCSKEHSAMLHSGANNVAHRSDVKEKKRQTNMERYGAKTWAESTIGRQTLRDIVTSEVVTEKMANTNLERYGATNWTQSDAGHARLREIMNDADMKQKIIDGYNREYGVDHYMKTSEGRRKARFYLTNERREKIRHSMRQRYGADSFLESDAFNRKRDIYLAQSWRTKRRRGTFSSSKPESTMKLLLQDVFGKDDVKVQYVSELYPFHCDFYIKSLDLYIELNAHWTHGFHWFDMTNPDDMKRLIYLKQRARTKGSAYYYQAIDIWTRRDLLKRQTAIKNHLNYLVFWDNDLSDFKAWLSQYQNNI